MSARNPFTHQDAFDALLSSLGGMERTAALLAEGEGADAAQVERMLGRMRALLPAGAFSAPAAPPPIEVRPQVLECDVVRFQNNKEKWVALVGLLGGYPYEIFTGLQDDEEGLMLPKSVTKGKIVKQVNADGTKRYDFQFANTRGYKITIEGISERFNPEYWNYAKLISGVLRYGMPIEYVIRLVASMSLQSESINTWKNGVERALKKYLPAGIDTDEATLTGEDDYRA